MIEITAGTFQVKATELVNVRAEPSTTAAKVGEIAAGATVTATGYTTQGQPYNNVTAWVRLGPGRWATYALVTGTLPPDAATLRTRLATCDANLSRCIEHSTLTLTRLREALGMPTVTIEELLLKVGTLAPSLTQCEQERATAVSTAELYKSRIDRIAVITQEGV